MTRELTWMGFLGTLLIVVALGLVILREPERQEEATLTQQAEAIVEGTLLFAENCVICHGASGEGLVANPPLTSEGMQGMHAADLFKTIERGRYNTSMAAYGVTEGGIFTGAQIDSIVTMLQYGNWSDVAATVDAMGLTPPEMPVMQITDELVSSVASLPEGDRMVAGLTVYAENCVACHGSNGEGTTLAPALNSVDLRTRLTDDDLRRIITQGVSGTLMTAWNASLTPAELDGIIAFIRRWDELAAAGVDMPVTEPSKVEMSPEMIATGAKLYNILCTQCHGTQGFGTPMAPALNNLTFLSQTPDAVIQQIIAGGVTGTSMPAWGGRLTESDIAALTAFLRSWEATAPPILPAR